MRLVIDLVVVRKRSAEAMAAFVREQLHLAKLDPTTILGWVHHQGERTSARRHIADMLTVFSGQIALDALYDRRLCQLVATDPIGRRASECRSKSMTYILSHRVQGSWTHGSRVAVGLGYPGVGASLSGLWSALLTLSACTPTPDGPPPIVLISFDTLRPDHLGAYGDPRGLTPALDQFAAESLLFEQAYAQATQTAPSHASLFTSRYPSELMGVSHQPVMDPAHPTLAQVLKAYGYQTGAFTAGGDLSIARALNPGFDQWESSADFGSLWHTGPMALAWLDDQDRDHPWLMFVHGYDAHSPYLKPTPYGHLVADPTREGPGPTALRSATERIIDRRLHRDFGGLLRGWQEILRPRAAAERDRFSALLRDFSEAAPVGDSDLDHVREVYAGGVAYADGRFGVFMAGLAARGVLDEAWVVVLSDHGEQLGEYGIFGHCCGVSDEESQVVLMIRPPGGGPARREAATVQLVDLMPTLVELAGGQIPTGVRGKSLTAALGGAALPAGTAFTSSADQIRMVSVRGAAGRLTYTGLDAGSPWLSALIAWSRLGGPGFTADGTVPEAARQDLRDALVAWSAALDPGPGRASPELPASLQKSLREHGYWDAAAPTEAAP